MEPVVIEDAEVILSDGIAPVSVRVEGGVITGWMARATGRGSSTRGA